VEGEVVMAMVALLLLILFLPGCQLMASILVTAFFLVVSVCLAAV
jgi:hypothetical protein